MTTTPHVSRAHSARGLNNGNFGLIDELVSPDFVDRTPQPGVSPTRDGFKQSAIALKTAFPDLRYAVEDSIASGDKIVHRLSGSGTMTGEFMGIPATGKRTTWTEIHVGRVANGRLTEHWGLADQLGMLVQLGIEAGSMSRPRPRISPTFGWSPRRSRRRARSRSPFAALASTRRSSSRIRRTSPATAAPTTWCEYVKPWTNPPPSRTASRRRPCRDEAEREVARCRALRPHEDVRPDPPVVHAEPAPGAPNPVITSSAMSRTPWRRQTSAIAGQ